MATYEDYLAQKAAFDPGYGHAAPEGKYWSVAGGANPLWTEDQWSADQARRAEVVQSRANWEAANPWFGEQNYREPGAYWQKNPDGSMYFKNQDTPGFGEVGNWASNDQRVPLEGVTDWQAEHAMDPSFLMRFPTALDYYNIMSGENVGATGGGVPTLNPDGTVAYDSLTGNLSPAQQAQQAANQTVLDQQNSLAGFQLAPGSPLTLNKTGQVVESPVINVGATGGGLLGQPSPTWPGDPGRSPDGDDWNAKDMETPSGLWHGLLGSVQATGPYTSGNMGNISPYWNPEPYTTGWHPDAFGTGYQQLQDMMTNPPEVEQVPFAATPEAPVASSPIPADGSWGNDMFNQRKWYPYGSYPDRSGGP